MNLAGRIIIKRASQAGFELEHIGCVDHILNVTTKRAGLDPKDVPHPLPEEYGALLVARQLCATMNRSSQLAEQLLKAQENYVTRPKKVIQDIVTRWWSTYSMLLRLLELKTYVDFVCSNNTTTLTNLNAAQWKLAEDIKIILHPFMLAQKLLEGEKYVTLSLVPTIIECVRRKLAEAIQVPTNTEYVNSMLQQVSKSFTANWGTGLADTQYADHSIVGPGKRHVGYRVLHMLAAFLDPRTKELKSFGAGDKTLIKNEVKRRGALMAKKQMEMRKLAAVVDPLATVVADGLAPVVAVAASCTRDVYWDLFTDLPSDRIQLPPALQDMDFALATNLEMMSYEREAYLERVVMNGVDENGENIIVFPNPLQWWAQHQGKYPILAMLSRVTLCVPATSAPCERLFSHAGLTIANDRASLLPDNAAEIIYLRVAWDKIEKLRA